METEHFVTLASRRDRHRLFFLLFIFKGNPKFYQPRDCPFLSLPGQRKKKNWELKFWYMTKTISRSGKLNWRNFPLQGKVYPHVIPTFPYTVRPCLFVAKKRVIWTVETRQRYLQQDALIIAWSFLLCLIFWEIFTNRKLTKLLVFVLFYWLSLIDISAASTVTWVSIVSSFSTKWKVSGYYLLNFAWIFGKSLPNPRATLNSPALYCNEYPSSVKCNTPQE